MNTEQAKQLGNHPVFIELAHSRRRAKITMVILMMGVFLPTQIIWAFFPEVIGIRFPAGGAVSLGVWFTVLVVVTAIILSGYYSLVMGKRLDALNEKLMREIEHENI